MFLKGLRLPHCECSRASSCRLSLRVISERAENGLKRPGLSGGALCYAEAPRAAGEPWACADGGGCAAHECLRALATPGFEPALHRPEQLVRVLVRMGRLQPVEELPAREAGIDLEPGLELGSPLNGPRPFEMELFVPAIQDRRLSSTPELFAGRTAVETSPNGRSVIT